MGISDIQQRHSEAHYQQGGAGDRDLSNLVVATLRKHAPSPQAVLDVGGGDGFLLELLEDAPKRYAVDISAESVRQMREKGVDAVQIDADADRLPFDDKSMDAITCVEVLEHLADPGKLLREFHRILADDGHLVVSVPNIYALPTLLLYWLDIPPINSARYGHVHYRDFTKRVLCGALKENDFEPISVRGTRIFPLNDPLTRWFAKCFPRWSHHLIACCRKSGALTCSP